MPSTSRDSTDLRAEPRYQFDHPLKVRFDSSEVTLLDLSTHGAQVENPSPLRVGKSGKIRIPIHGIPPAELPAKVVWCHYGRDGKGSMCYHAGLEIDEERRYLAADLIDLLVRLRKVHRDDESMKKKEASRALREAGPKPPQGVRKGIDPSNRSQQVAIALKVRDYLRAHPEEAEGWRKQGRVAARHAGRVTDEEAWSVHEFLGGRIDIDTIDLAMKL